MKISEEERVTIHKRLQIAILKDQKKNPNTYETPCNFDPYLTRAQQYEDEEVLLMELTSPDGSMAKIYPEFE